MGVPPSDAKTVERVSRERLVLATQPGRQALRRAKLKPLGYVDVGATLERVAAERDRLQGIYEQKRSKTLVAPQWPVIPDALDLKAPPVVADTEAGSRVALGIARWVERMAIAWADIERQRVVRAYMIEAGDDPSVRPLPVAMAA